MAYESTKGTEAAGSDAAAADSFVDMGGLEVKCQHTYNGGTLTARCLWKKKAACVLSLKTALGDPG